MQKRGVAALLAKIDPLPKIVYTNDSCQVIDKECTLLGCSDGGSTKRCLVVERLDFEMFHVFVISYSMRILPSFPLPRFSFTALHSPVLEAFWLRLFSSRGVKCHLPSSSYLQQQLQCPLLRDTIPLPIGSDRKKRRAKSPTVGEKGREGGSKAIYKTQEAYQRSPTSASVE